MLLHLVGHVIGTLALSPLADRAGRRDLLLVTMVISGVGSALTALVGSYGWFVAATTITGVGIGADLAIVNTLHQRDGAATRARSLYVANLPFLGAWRRRWNLAWPVAYHAADGAAALGCYSHSRARISNTGGESCAQSAGCSR